MPTSTMALIHPHRAILPEIDLYTRYFSSKGWTVHTVDQASTRELPNYQVRWHLMGLDCTPGHKHQVIIHEYISPSVPPFASLKDTLKRLVSTTPHGRVFAFPAVSSRFGFSDNRPTCFRSPGVASWFFNTQPSPKKSFDFVYTGSMAPVRQLHRPLRQLLATFPGCRILLVGEPAAELWQTFQNQVTFSGKVPPQEVPTLLASAEYGLNLIPNQRPFRELPSLKLLEYCAAGLPVISSDVPWVRSFERQRNARFFFLPKESTQFGWTQLRNFSFQIPDVRDLHWENALEQSGLNEWLLKLIPS